MKQLNIELRYDFKTQEQEDAVIEAAKIAAKHLLTQAMFLADQRKPDIKLMTESLLFGKDEISLADDLDAHSSE